MAADVIVPLGRGPRAGRLNEDVRPDVLKETEPVHPFYDHNSESDWAGAAGVAPARRRRRPARLHDLAPARDDLRAQVLVGLGHSAKRLPCKLFYDRRGSQLFDRICELPEYYLTRAELGILQRHAAEMAAALGERCLLVEYGSGSGVKTRLLLDALKHPAAYVPLDISREHLLEAAGRLAAAYPALDVLPVCADYASPFTLPPCASAAARTVVYFPGSTIGNFEPAEARAFLRATADRCGAGGGMLVGVDLKKEPATLHAAYNDAAGVTAAFNLNVLARINRELGGTFALDRFDHYAFYNPHAGRVEMHLSSRDAQTARAAGARFAFAQGETIFTESSYKYTPDEFEALAVAGGWKVARVWTDEARQFGVHYLTAA
jgi:dimethylhistidine N-methyltransferase